MWKVPFCRASRALSFVSSRGSDLSALRYSLAALPGLLLSEGTAENGKGRQLLPGYEFTKSGALEGR